MDRLEQTDISGYVHTSEEQEGKSITDTLLHIVPTNPIKAMVEGDMLAIIFFAVVFGLGVAAIGEKGKPVLRFFEGMANAMFYVTNLFMKYAPIGVFALIGVTISKYGFASLLPLGKLALTVYGTMIFFVFVILGLMGKFVGFSIFKLIKMIKEELIISMPYHCRRVTRGRRGRSATVEFRPAAAKLLPTGKGRFPREAIWDKTHT